MFNRIRVWNMWRKNNLNGSIHKILVLLGLRTSPTFDFFRSFDVLSKYFTLRKGEKEK